MKPALVVLAAGIGSRYGGIKQIEPVGPSGEIILEYSVFDAIRSGFGKVVFVIRRDIEKDFAEHVLKRFSSRIPCEYVFQDLHALPDGFSVPQGRIKPWGTGHAILMAKSAVREPFAVINADDYYGRDAFAVIGDCLSATDAKGKEFSMVGYALRNTVSDYGSVSRGICQVDSRGLLTSVVEHTKITRKSGDVIESHLPDGSTIRFSGDETVSMNLFGFTPVLFENLETQFREFLVEKSADQKAELYIPTVANRMIHEGSATLKVLRSQATWFGITYREDLPTVVENIRKLTTQGEYPTSLWS